MTTILIQLDALGVRNTFPLGQTETQLRATLTDFLANAPELKQDDTAWKLKYIRNVYLGEKEPELIKTTVRDWDKSLWHRFQVDSARMTLAFNDYDNHIQPDIAATQNLFQSAKMLTGQYEPGMPLVALLLDTPDKHGQPALSTVLSYWQRTDININPEQYAIAELRLVKSATPTGE